MIKFFLDKRVLHMGNRSSKNIRKYLDWTLFLIAVVLVAVISSKLYKMYETNKLKSSVLSRIVGTIQYDDIENAFGELVSDDFIFISYVKSEEVQKLETKLKNVIVNNDLQNNFFYLDATDLMLEENYCDILNERFSLSDENRIEEIPALIYFKDGQFIKTITSTSDNMMSSDDFSKLLDNYEIIERK